jgi:NADH:ubiquinone oxidoreductase subunit F (NADH-binding)
LFNNATINFSMADLVSHPDEVKVVSRRFGQGATDIDRYLELDGYKAVKKALAMEPDAIVNEVKNSALRGRGGAGFSTGMKWSFVPKQSAKPKYVLCNGDESEPGTCKDRLLFEHDPHAVIEGVVIGGLAVGARSGYIYIRGEYRYLSVIMQKALRDAYAKGFLGKNIFGSGRDFDIYWHGGAGAYEVGEESALMESLEGKRGIPRICGAVRQSLTMPKHWPTCLTLSWVARTGTPSLAPPKMAARACSASVATLPNRESTSSPWAITSKKCCTKWEVGFQTDAN